MAGLLALVGGDEFNPGNEQQDRVLARAAGPGPAYVVPTAAARHDPARAVGHAARWFAQFDIRLRELRVLKRGDAMSEALAEQARGGGFFYLVGGDPGIVPAVLRDSPVWRAIFEAWRGGAVLAGSSAGSMALCSDTLVRVKWPNRANRRPVPGLDVLQSTAVLPHYDTFGADWVDSAQAAAPGLTLLGLDERTAAVWRDGAWTALGPGAVTVIRGTRSARFTSGEEVKGLRQPARILRR